MVFLWPTKANFTGYL